jgi:hypothetical protein
LHGIILAVKGGIFDRCRVVSRNICGAAEDRSLRSLAGPFEAQDKLKPGAYIYLAA